MNLQEYASHIHAINESISALKEEAKNLYETSQRILEEVETPSLDQVGVSQFERYVVCVSDDNLGVECHRDVVVDPFRVTVEQLARRTRQRGYPITMTNKWKTEMGNIGSLTVKKNSRMIFKDRTGEVSFELEPINDYNIQNETLMSEVMEEIVEGINQKADESGLAIRALLEPDTFNDDLVRFIIESAEEGEDTEFKIQDANGKLAEHFGIRRETNTLNYKKGADCLYTIDDVSYQQRGNEVTIADGQIRLLFRGVMENPTTVQFIPDSVTISSSLLTIFEQTVPFLDFLRANKIYLRSDLLNLVVHYYRESGAEIFGLQFDAEEGLSIDEPRLHRAIETDKELFRQFVYGEEGILTFYSDFAKQILEKPFVVFAKEWFNPSVFIHPHTTTRINRNLLSATHLNERF